MELDEDCCKAIESLQRHSGFHLLQTYMEEHGLPVYNRRLLAKVVTDTDKAEHNHAVGVLAGARQVFGVPYTIRETYKIMEDERIQDEMENRKTAELLERENNDGYGT
jgi:hypothetical protein